MRHLEGWQLAVVAVGMAALTAALVVPRPVRPTDLPLPTVDRAEEATRAAADVTRIRAAGREPLPFLVRAAGETIRAFGLEEAANAKNTERLATEVRERIEVARKAHGDEPILALRAIQESLFVQAVRSEGSRRHAPPATWPAELRELGGAFVERLERDPALSERLEPEELACLFRFRWSRLSGLMDTRPFRPSLNEWRLYHRTFLVHPELRGTKKRGERLRADLGTVLSLAKLDPDYPHELSRGIIEYKLGNPAAAAGHFRAHLLRHPGGEYRLRAQNYLVEAASK